jgi:hypothetical protein
VKKYSNRRNIYCARCVWEAVTNVIKIFKYIEIYLLYVLFVILSKVLSRTKVRKYFRTVLHSFRTFVQQYVYFTWSSSNEGIIQYSNHKKCIRLAPPLHVGSWEKRARRGRVFSLKSTKVRVRRYKTTWEKGPRGGFLHTGLQTHFIGFRP